MKNTPDVDRAWLMFENENMVCYLLCHGDVEMLLNVLMITSHAIGEIVVI